MHIRDYLQLLVDKDGSDLHLKAGGPAYVRIDGELSEIHDLPWLYSEDTERFAREVLDGRALDHFESGAEADCAYAVHGLGRFRVAVFRQRGSTGLVLRRVLPGNQSFDELGLPPVCRAMAEEHRGLVLVTGPTGSGKTTTTAAMIGHINATRRSHIVTIEDPIEILHRTTCRSSTSARSAWTPTTSPAPCVPSPVRTPMSSSSVRCATWRR